MNVLVVCDVLGEENNGTTIAAMNLIRFLKSSGDNVRILCADKNRAGEKNTFVVPNIYLGCLINHILKKNNVALAYPKTSVIKEALKNVDVVHVILPFALGVKTAKIARKMGIPVTAGFHCQAENFTSHIFNTMNSKLINKLVYKTFYRKLYKYVNAIHYPTEFIKDVFKETVKRKTNAYVISNGVNDIYKKQNVIREEVLNNKFNILFIGRLSKEKSHPVLLKAIKYSKYKDKIQLVFAGKGPREKNIVKLAKKLKINMPIINFYSREDLVKVINSSDLYVHPAEIEIEAISCLEAITCGVVPIISDSPRSATNRFALSDQNLFKNNDPKDLARKIDYWIEHPNEKMECSNNYIGYTMKFNQTDCMIKMRNMLLTYAKKENHTTKKIIYYRDEINDDFANNGVQSKPVSKNFKYIHKNVIYRFFEFILYFIIAKPVVFILNKLVYKQKICDNLLVEKKELKGCFMYANHTLSMGDAYTPNLIFNRKNNIIVNPAAFSIRGISTIVDMLGGMPLPSTLLGTKKFLEAIEHKTEKGQSITIYPEAHIWPYYTKIRNFSASSFKYPVELNRPVLCITNTFVQLGNKAKLITYLDGPFYPDKTIDKKEAAIKLRNEVFDMMNYRSKEFKQFERIKYINLNDIEVK